jgi:hypothetical protein
MCSRGRSRSTNTSPRVDHRFKGGDTLFARYTFDDGKVDRQPTSKPPIAFTREHSRNQYPDRRGTSASIRRRC